MKALVVDTVARNVREVELPDENVARLHALNALVGGYLETAHMWPTGDVMFVDEDGLRHDWRTGFVFLPRFEAAWPRRFLGSGVVVGREVEGEELPDGWTHVDPAITADELRRLVRFFTR